MQLRHTTTIALAVALATGSPEVSLAAPSSPAASPKATVKTRTPKTRPTTPAPTAATSAATRPAVATSAASAPAAPTSAPAAATSAPSAPASTPAASAPAAPASAPAPLAAASQPSSKTAAQHDKGSKKPGKDGDVYSLSLEALLSTRVSVASKQDEALTMSPGIVSTIKMRDMLKLGLRTLKDALEFVPNVVVVETPVGSTSVSIRGISETFNQKVLFLLEGVPYWMSSHGDIPLLGLPLTMIDRIEIIRGPGAVMYGTNASAGVINVILVKNAEKATVTLSGGSLGELRAELHASYTHEGGYSYLGASIQRQISGYSAFFPQTVVVPPFNTVPGAFPSSGSLTKREQSASIVAGVKHRGFDALVQLFESSQNGLGGAAVIFQPNTLKYLGALAHVGYRHRRENVDFAVSLDHSVFFLDLAIANFLGEVDTANSTVRARDGRQLYRSPLRDNSRTRLLLNANLRFTPQLSLLLGGEEELRRAGRYVKTDSQENEVAEQSQATTVNEASLYAQVDFSWRSLRLVLGARFVHNSLAGAHLSPRAALVYALSSKHSLKLLYSEGFSSPVISQQDLMIPFVVAGNPDLSAEIMRTLELAYLYASSRLQISANAYLLHTSDVITRTKQDGDREPRYRNVAGYWRYGGELDAKLSLVETRRAWAQSLKLLANLSYNHQGNSQSADDPLAHFVPRLQANLGVLWTLFDHHTIGGSMRLISPRDQVDWQHIATLAYTLRYESVSVFVQLQNFTDHRIVDPDINAGTIPQVPGGPGRSLYGGLSYRY
jgi:outer membrane receptor for ferrienterochelin and colicins